jgi:type IV pilus assembly protein PilW
VTARHRDCGPGRARARGVTLIELMVSLVLGLIVAAAAMGVFLTNRQTYLATENLGRLQEGARVAFELMGRDIRSASVIPCSNETSLNNIVDSTAWWAGRGTGATEALEWMSASFQGYTAGGSDALQLVSAIPPAITPTVVTAAPSAGSLPMSLAVNSIDGIEAGDLLMVCDYGYFDATSGAKRSPEGAIFQATTVGSGAIGIAETGGAPGNSMSEPNLFIPESPQVPQPNALVSVLRPVRWYIGDNARGGKSLFRTRLDNDGGTLSLAEDEIVPNADAMDLAYLVTGGTEYVAASAVADWTAVIAVRVQLHMTGTDRIDGSHIERTLEHVVTLRNRAL